MTRGRSLLIIKWTLNVPSLGSYSWLFGHINIVIMNFNACSVTVRMLQHISCNLKLDNQRSCLSSWSIFDLVKPTLLNTLMNNKIPVLSIRHDQMVDSWWNKLVEVTCGVPKRQSMMHVSVLSGMEVLRQLFNTSDFLHDQIKLINRIIILSWIGYRQEIQWK